MHSCLQYQFSSNSQTNSLLKSFTDQALTVECCTQILAFKPLTCRVAVTEVEVIVLLIVQVKVVNRHSIIILVTVLSSGFGTCCAATLCRISSLGRFVIDVTVGKRKLKAARTVEAMNNKSPLHTRKGLHRQNTRAGPYTEALLK